MKNFIINQIQTNAFTFFIITIILVIVIFIMLSVHKVKDTKRCNEVILFQNQSAKLLSDTQQCLTELEASRKLIETLKHNLIEENREKLNLNSEIAKLKEEKQILKTKISELELTIKVIEQKESQRRSEIAKKAAKTRKENKNNNKKIQK